jgi:hypothetical protein
MIPTRRILLLALSGLVACTFGHIPVLRSNPVQETAAAAWAPALLGAQQDADGGRHAAAERTLTEFVAAYPGTAEAIEATFWRGVFALDPANERASAREAIRLLNRYLEHRHALTHRAEAGVLLRLATALSEQPREAAPRANPAGADGRDAEIAKLKEELENTKAELERIRKRLATPPTTPPPAPPPPTPPPGES